MSKSEVVARVVARPKPLDVAVPAVPVVVPHAYAIAQDAAGGWHALHLEGVTAQKCTRMEPNTRPEPGMFAVSRLLMAIEKRYRERKWGK